jgi:phage terminase large subunit-like protein
MFDAAKATRVCRFFERVLKHPKEKYKPFLLLAWERYILRQIFGRVDERGLREVQRAYLEVPKKNGKSELAAGVALYMLVSDGESAAEVYGAATTKAQAGIVFNVAASMVLASPFLKAKLKVIWSTKRIVRRDDPLSYYAALSADGDAQDGINPHCVVIDELHRWKTARALALYEVLTKGTVARSQPLIFEITTAGSTEEESPLCWQEHEYARMLAENSFEDKRFFGKIYAADPKDDWTAPATWAKANPSLDVNGGFLKTQKIQTEVDQALRQPRRKPAVLRFHLGIWTASDAEWMTKEIWDGCAAAPGTLLERPCYLGLDLSSCIDLTALVALFPADDGAFDVLPFFWMAKERVREREEADRVPYSVWAREGHLLLADGDVIDQRVVHQKIKWCTEVFDVRALAYDPHHAQQLAIEINGETGLPVIPVPQNFTHMSEATKKTMTLALQKKLNHGGHPILRWNALCTRVKGNDQDDIRPVKPERNKSAKRIDGMVALILAVSRASFHKRSVYEGRGLLSTP